LGIRLDEIIKDPESVEAYILFRNIEDWCNANIPITRFRFDYSATICVYGVDIPGRIIFKSDEDANVFRLMFGR